MQGCCHHCSMLSTVWKVQPTIYLVTLELLSTVLIPLAQHINQAAQPRAVTDARSRAYAYVVTLAKLPI